MAPDSTPALTTTATEGPTPAQKSAAMFRPPVNRAMRVLDRSFFRRTVPLAAARVSENNQIAKTQKLLDKSGDLLTVPRIMSVRLAPDPAAVANDVVHKRREDKPRLELGMPSVHHFRVLVGVEA